MLVRAISAHPNPVASDPDRVDRELGRPPPREIPQLATISAAPTTAAPPPQRCRDVSLSPMNSHARAAVANGYMPERIATGRSGTRVRARAKAKLPSTSTTRQSPSPMAFREFRR